MLNSNKTGLIVGVFVGILHLVWSVFVVLGIAQLLMNWIFGLHFLNNPFQISAFNIGTAALLVLVTFAVGYVFGSVFARLWNTIQRKP